MLKNKSKPLLVLTLVLFCTSLLNAQTDDKVLYSVGKDLTYHGHNYSTIILGNGQEWMAENLKTTQYNDGSLIPLLTDPALWAVNYNTGATLPMMCWYDNEQDSFTANKFGALYNWYAINSSTNGNKYVCPDGWHIPTDDEWTVLINYIDPDADGGNNMNRAGAKMKTEGTQYWRSPNTDASNESGFSGLPGGSRGHYGSYLFIENDGRWWSSTEDGTSYAWYRYLGYDHASANRYSNNKTSALSVRCVRD